MLTLQAPLCSSKAHAPLRYTPIKLYVDMTKVQSYMYDNVIAESTVSSENYSLIFCMSARLSVRPMHAWYLQRQKRAADPLELR